jgi:type IV fimbrial biogenesis protein FimT
MAPIVAKGFTLITQALFCQRGRFQAGALPAKWGRVMQTQSNAGIKRVPREFGFTLIEILVTIAIAAVLASIAVPNLSQFLRKVKLNSLSNSLVASLQQGRSEAIKRNKGVLVCAANATATDCAASTDWASQGWLVCYDFDNNGACDTSTTTNPNPIRIDPALDPAFATVVSTAAQVRFTPSGSLASGTPAMTISITGTWTGATPLTVTVAATGLIKGSRL